MADCGICCEKLNQSTRKEICCVFCDYVVCRSCFQKYAVETSLDPHCMNCKKTFTFDFISEHCTSVFITKTLKSHRENVLFDREKSLLPETQPYVVVETQKKNIKKQIDVLNAELFELRRQERVIQIKVGNLQYEMNRITINNVNAGETAVTVEDRKKFIRKCPMDECRGFLSTAWKCGSCEKRICNKCNEEKLDNHVCKPENVASMELLNKDTKPCPTCGTMIFRISGCSQMFCTDCHTAWDWNTQRVVNGVIHNPHYYEFLNRNGGQRGRNHGDIPCGGLPDAYDMRNVITNIFGNPTNSNLMRIHNCIAHIQHYELRHHVVADPIVANRDLRIKYLMNDIPEAAFKATLQQSEKKRQKVIAFRNIYQMFVDVGSDIFRQIHVYYRDNYRVDKGAIKNFINENITILNNLIDYFNENLKKNGKMYKCVYPGISEDFMFQNNIEAYKRQPTGIPS